MQLKESYYIATNVCSRKSATTFGDLPDWLVRILMQSLPTRLILLISIAANELYVCKSFWVPHAGTGPKHNTQLHSELCFSLNSLTLFCLMSVFANRHA